ncbi:hypothetical protein HELRODRAFT_168417 [Helobdella robusta]|uniref:Uncharacterized protein n=1 Tax=Helobdella robusta TaxID=6412 RepID=T1F0K4_HELRO|nr:hypothetical protein HELRODRAFT_168417 [Helobdella robusta]ESO09434.1 hypothetical protein HELRODRAFT_168417 [Helobdella robusta]
METLPIKPEAAEKLLYHWKSLPIVLPPSITDDNLEAGDGFMISFKDLFVAPTFDELEQVARDSKGNMKKLNRKQLMNIRNMGEFEVESINFPGQAHKWRLNLLLQKGFYRTHESFLDDLALALKMLIIYSKNRFESPFFSLSQSYRSLKKSVYHFLGLERVLLIHKKPNECSAGKQVDANFIMNQSYEILSTILKQESRGWYIKYKDKIITDLKGLLLVNQAKCALNTNKNLTALKEKFEICKDEYTANLTKQYPVRSRIDEWLKAQLSIFWVCVVNISVNNWSYLSRIPAGVVLLHLFSVTIYDFDHPADERNRWLYIFEVLVYKFIVCSCLQPICAFVVATLVFPLAALAICIGGMLRRTGRVLWDCLMYHLVIKKRGRVPTKDAFIVRRIAGPGLASKYYLQVRPEQALAAVEACVEAHELNVWMECYSDVINQPKQDYKKFVELCFKPFSCVLIEDGVYQSLVQECNAQLKLLKHTIDSQKQKLNTGLNADLRSKIRLTSRELKVVIAQSSKMLESFYPNRIFRIMSKTEARFWEDRNLDYRDWQGLATQLLTEVFSSSFLIPLEEIDTCFKLDVTHLNLSKYLEMLKSSEFRDDLDVVSALHTPKGDIDVSAPYMNINLFSPLSDTSIHVNAEKFHDHRRRMKVRCFWPGRRRRRSNKAISTLDTLSLQHVQKLSQPLPIPHPSLICLIIHNREDSRYNIDMNNLVCQKILQYSVEQQPYVDPSLMSTSTTTDNESCEASVNILQQQQQMLMQHNRSTLQLKQQQSPTSLHDISPVQSKQQQQQQLQKFSPMSSTTYQAVVDMHQQSSRSMGPVCLAKQESITSDITLSEYNRASLTDGSRGCSAPMVSSYHYLFI